LQVTVNIPVALRQYTRNESNLLVEADTVGELLGRLDSSFPGLSALIVDERGELRRYVNVFVNQDDVRVGGGLTTKLKEGDKVSIVPVVAGG
jgi:molybdopterin synthase sulfur carrier subunit